MSVGVYFFPCSTKISYDLLYSELGYQVPHTNIHSRTNLKKLFPISENSEVKY